MLQYLGTLANVYLPARETGLAELRRALEGMDEKVLE